MSLLLFVTVDGAKRYDPALTLDQVCETLSGNLADVLFVFWHAGELQIEISYIYGLMILGIIGFQIALILGAPWGRLTQGGQVTGSLPRSGRIVAAVSIGILTGMALSVLSAAGHWPNWPSWTGWLAVAVNAISMVLNWITPSPPERKLWAPIMTVMFATATTIVWF